MIRATFLLLLVLGVPLQAQSTVSFSSLGATIKSFRFYASGAANMPAAERVYRNSFDSATVKFIGFELILAYPRASSAVTAWLDCEYRSGGGNVTPHRVPVAVAVGEEGSIFGYGWGSVNGGYWRPGSYLMTCRDGPTTVTYGTFEVTRNLRDIPAIGGMVTSVRVLESPRRLPPVAERVYAVVFDSATTRYVTTEIGLDFPPATAPAQFLIACTYRYPNGETRNFQFTARVETGWKDSIHSGGWGNDVPGTWPKGTYEITCSHADRQLFLRTFHIL